MTENGEGEPIVEATHVIDAFIVACIVFFSVLGGDALASIAGGEEVLITNSDVASRLITAGLAFGMTFFAQWARYRGLKLTSALPVSLDDKEK